MMVMEEICTYSQSQRCNMWTDYKQEARIHAFLPLVSGKVESFSLDTMKAKSNEGMNMIEDLCQRIQRDGVASLLPSLDEFRSLDICQLGSKV